LIKKTNRQLIRAKLTDLKSLFLAGDLKNPETSPEIRQEGSLRSCGGGGLDLQSWCKYHRFI